MPTKLESLRGRRKPLERAPSRKNVMNDSGTVRISVILIDKERGQHRKGNVTRHFHVSNARVTTVARRIEECLFKDGAAAEVPYVTL